MAGEGLSYELKITLQRLEPPVWRRVELPGWTTLRDLHHVIQLTMGWHDAHLHQFEIGDGIYGAGHDEADDEEVDEETVTVAEVFEKGTSGTYTYDFGDCWDHEIVAERIFPATYEGQPVSCIDGARACPPEDCGGVRGYEGLLLGLSDVDSEEYALAIEILGPDFDPDSFDLDEVNLLLRRLSAG
jgi:hypothetical protein